MQEIIFVLKNECKLVIIYFFGWTKTLGLNGVAQKVSVSLIHCIFNLGFVCVSLCALLNFKIIIFFKIRQISNRGGVRGKYCLQSGLK